MDSSDSKLIDKSKKGNLVEFTSKLLQRNLLSDDSTGRHLYRMSAVDAAGKSHTILSTQGKASDVAFQPDLVTRRKRCQEPFSGKDYQNWTPTSINGS